MIIISGSLVKASTIVNQYSLSGVEVEITKTLSSSPKVFSYNSMKQLRFELALRKSIIQASIDLNNSNFEFRVFKDAYCNTDYWKLTSAGGFVLKKDVNSSIAIKDIYINSSKYGTECATAIVIVYLKALVDILPENLFLELFPEIYLFSWIHLDSDLGIYDFENPSEYLPGDCRYFSNPDHDPKKPEWQGENAVDLGNGIYYGHGIGLKSESEIINELNSARIPDSKISAYLMKTAKRPDFKYLAKRYYAATSAQPT